MTFKRWWRAHKSPVTPSPQADEALSAARDRVAAAEDQLQEAKELRRMSERSLRINNFAPMMNEVFGLYQPHNRRKGDPR